MKDEYDLSKMIVSQEPLCLKAQKARNDSAK